jgi:hypothetical protein
VDMYLKLRDAVVATMNDSERADWDMVTDLPTEAQLTLLVSYVEHMGIASHPLQTLDHVAAMYHETMLSYVRAGFNEDQAMRMLEITARTSR